MSEPFDIAVIGGGINGTGIVRDAAGRGLKALLVESGDLASGTSSASTKLIHGGLRYLEHYAFSLVRHALAEREILWASAPHIIWPMRFVLPHRPGLRPAWFLRLGLFVYDHMGGRKLLPKTQTLRLERGAAGDPLEGGGIAFEYSDCWVQDSRLVVLNARDAVARGADVRVHTRFVAARPKAALWQIDLENVPGGDRYSVEARAIVNAAGPWVGEALGRIARTSASARVRLVQGSHIVVPQLYQHEHAYVFQNPDGRIIFAIPYEEEFTLIGTTDRDFDGDARKVEATAAEIAYLCEATSRYFRRKITPTDVIWTYSGVRPLYDDGASAAKVATRDYALTLEGGGDTPTVLSVFGGKITTYRRLAEDALEKITGVLPQAKTNAGWTASARLPGGDFPVDDADALAVSLRRKYPFLTLREALRFVRHYGTDTWQILGESCQRQDLGHRFGGDITEAEVAFLMDHEFARNAEDVVWRRTKSGLRMPTDEIAALEKWMEARKLQATVISSCGTCCGLAQQ